MDLISTQESCQRLRGLDWETEGGRFNSKHFGRNIFSHWELWGGKDIVSDGLAISDCLRPPTELWSLKERETKATSPGLLWCNIDQCKLVELNVKFTNYNFNVVLCEWDIWYHPVNRDWCTSRQSGDSNLDINVDTLTCNSRRISREPIKCGALQQFLGLR